MAYIGVPHLNKVSPAFLKEDFLGSNLSTITVSGVAHTNAVALSIEVPGGNTENIHVVLDNVVQEPDVAYTIHNDADGNPKILKFAGAIPSSGSIYMIHRGVGTINMKPPAGSVGVNELAANLKSFTTDVATGDGSTVAFTLSEEPANVAGIMVFVDGILQKATTNYSLSGTTLTFTTAPAAAAEIETKHLTIRSIARRSTDFQYDTFTGDGSTVAFTLGTAGATTNSAFIFYNGIALKPTSDYSISGVTLTLTFAPVALSEIMARYQI
jgi:hypothetical protein